MATYEETAQQLSDIHDARLRRFMESGMDTTTFRAVPENAVEFELMLKLSAELDDLKDQQSQ